MKKLFLSSLLLFALGSYACENPLVFKFNNEKERAFYSRVGLQNNDIIMKVNSETVCSGIELQKKMVDSLKTKKISLTVKRNNEIHTLNIKSF